MKNQKKESPQRRKSHQLSLSPGHTVTKGQRPAGLQETLSSRAGTPNPFPKEERFIFHKAMITTGGDRQQGSLLLRTLLGKRKGGVAATVKLDDGGHFKTG